ncbi:MAG: hypothetical protein J7J27_05225 [Euryarchaeota archaeon]|nr:hypothetical protein [Euryarchaeota archaeon]
MSLMQDHEKSFTKNKTQFIHVSADIEDVFRYIESVLSALEVKYSKRVHSNKEIVISGKGFRIRLLSRYYGTQIAISGRKSSIIKESLEIVLPKAVIPKRHKEEKKALEKHKNEIFEEIKTKYYMSVMSLIGTVLTVASLIPLVAVSAYKGSLIGVIAVILQVGSILNVFTRHKYRKRKRGVVLMEVEYVPLKVLEYRRKFLEMKRIQFVTSRSRR